MAERPLLKGLLARFNPTDAITAGYLVLTAVLVTTLSPGNPNLPRILLAHAALLAVQLALVMPRRAALPPVLRFFRDWYPVVFCAYLYPESGLMNDVLFEPFLDSAVISLERFVFGGMEPSNLLHPALDHRLMVEYMHFSYFLYYFYIPLVGLVLWFDRSRREMFKRYMFAVMLCFLSCYLIFMLFPVQGPLPLRDDRFHGFFVDVMDYVYRLDTPGGAFPSSHVAVVGVVVAFAFRRSPAFGFALLPFAASLVVSTVYCMYHYAVDALAGMLYAGVVVAVSDRIFAWMSGFFGGAADETPDRLDVG